MLYPSVSFVPSIAWQSLCLSRWAKGGVAAVWKKLTVTHLKPFHAADGHVRHSSTVRLSHNTESRHFHQPYSKQSRVRARASNLPPQKETHASLNQVSTHSDIQMSTRANFMAHPSSAPCIVVADHLQRSSRKPTSPATARAVTGPRGLWRPAAACSELPPGLADIPGWDEVLCEGNGRQQTAGGLAGFAARVSVLLLLLFFLVESATVQNTWAVSLICIV